MNKSCSNTNSKIGRVCSFFSALPKGGPRSFLLVWFLAVLSQGALAVTVTSLKGNVFVIFPQGKVQEAHYGLKLPDMTEIMTDETAQVAWRDDAGNFFQLAAGGHVRFLNQILELQQGNLWLKVTHPTSLSVQTANSVIDFKKADGIISYEGETSRTQVLATHGQFVLSNILMPEAHEVIGPGQFSFLEPTYENGMPRVATNVGKNSYKKMTQLFIGHNENGLESVRASSGRLPASVATDDLAGAPAPKSLPGPQLAAAAQVPANLSPTAAPPRVGPALQAAPLNEVKKQKSGQEMQVKTYGQVDEQREAPPRLQGPDKKQKNRKTGQQNKPAVPEQKVGEKPRVTPGQIVYYLPDYAQDHQVQREKIATFYEQQVAVMAATPTPKKFEPDYTTPSNTVVKVLGRKAGVGVAHAPAEQGRMEDKVEKGSSSVANRAVASAAEDAMAGAASAPAVKTTKVKTVVQADASSSSSAAAPQTEASGASAKRDVASVGQENRPLEQVTLEQFTQQMRLRNETDQLIHELQSYRIDRQGR